MSTQDHPAAACDSGRSPAGLPYWRVLIAAWGGRLPAHSIDYACAALNPGAMFHVVAAVAPHDADDPDAMPRARCQSANMMQAACNLLVARGRHANGELLTLPQRDSNSAELLAAAAARWGTDLVLTSWSSPAHVARFARCPVLLLPDVGTSHYGAPPRRFFVASDDSDASCAAVDEVTRIMAPGDEHRIARVALDPRNAPPADTVDAVVLQASAHGGNLARAIAAAALEWQADLLVLGTHAGEPSDKWRFASIAEQVAQINELPLLLVPLVPQVRSGARGR
ncbi:universal stress protein [Paraburkholderia rhizosphaerae]|uniref:Nucleotide-binding universal stress UspA family protein n=1 Tax=Paraburkholderia rhizosphaerae TaxID=480658 RepID=A0A4R8LTL5_9BURK|nr:universal stress protein [Paraburkholderia rhizosphaerae]TDY50944.1 nucleotide-binding universal stress UspA family protein [Paraburkholderia rhizosphaerae]